jgi:hypothetical protein
LPGAIRDRFDGSRAHIFEASHALCIAHLNRRGGAPSKRRIDWVAVNLPRWIPHPASWAAAIALFVFGLGVSVATAFLLPLVIELMRFSPRLGWLGFLALWLAPIPVAASIHRATQGLLDLSDSGMRRGGSSLWAGFFAWATFIFVTVTTGLVMLVLDPPPVDPGAMFALVAEVQRGGAGVVRCAIWVVFAAYAYELERGIRTARDDSSTTH